jgi:hypothetical protein
MRADLAGLSSLVIWIPDDNITGGYGTAFHLPARADHKLATLELESQIYGRDRIAQLQGLSRASKLCLGNAAVTVRWAARAFLGCVVQWLALRGATGVLSGTLISPAPDAIRKVDAAELLVSHDVIFRTGLLRGRRCQRRYALECSVPERAASHGDFVCVQPF